MDMKHPNAVPDRSYDRLNLRGNDLGCNAGAELSRANAAILAGNQKNLCMIGDSVTWAEDGDWFRRHLLSLIPELAFIGTHSAVLGYAHAGEGGDATWDTMKRINDPERIPDAPYYHLLIGINDCGGAKTPEQTGAVASETESRIVQLVNALLERPCTEKVFLASVLPGPFDENWESTPRDMAGSETNAGLRNNFSRYFPEGNVVWIEYEKPLRAMGELWKNPETIRGAHPSMQGYRLLAELAAPVLKREMKNSPVPCAGSRIGVEVRNLWQSDLRETVPLLPGWYILSFAPGEDAVVDFTLYSTGAAEQGRFEKHYRLPVVPGERVEVEFMTGYERYGYTRAAFQLQFSAGSADNIQVEKMRPRRRASRYGEGVFLDSETPVSAGEKLFWCK